MNIIEFGKNYSPMVYINKTWVRWLSGTFMRTIQPFRSLPLRLSTYINLKKSTELIMDFPKMHQLDVFCLTFIDQKVYD